VKSPVAKWIAEFSTDDEGRLWRAIGIVAPELADNLRRTFELQKISSRNDDIRVLLDECGMDPGVERYSVEFTAWLRSMATPIASKVSLGKKMEQILWIAAALALVGLYFLAQRSRPHERDSGRAPGSPGDSGLEQRWRLAAVVEGQHLGKAEEGQPMSAQAIIGMVKKTKFFRVGTTAEMADLECHMFAPGQIDRNGRASVVVVVEFSWSQGELMTDSIAALTDRLSRVRSPFNVLWIRPVDDVRGLLDSGFVRR